MLAENFVTWLIGFHSLLVTGTRIMQAVVKCSGTQGGVAFTEISCGTWMVKGFLHMCVFTVSDPPIIRGQEVALKGRFASLPICTLCNTDVHFAAFTRLPFAGFGRGEFLRGGRIVPRKKQNACAYL